MSELIIEGLTDTDLITIYELISDINIAFNDKEKYQKISNLHNKLEQIINYFKETQECDSV